MNDEPQGVLEQIVDEIVQHDHDYPDHGTGCACHDHHAAAIRRLLREKVPPNYWNKSLSNLFTVLNYVMRNP